ncbi:MAG: metallophosphoesterase, partial [Reyranellales bacterium]
MLIAQLSDPHIKSPGQLLYDRIDTAGYLERAVAHVLKLDPLPDVVVMTGDLVDGGKPEEYAYLRRLIAPLPMPVYVIPGNHDGREALMVLSERVRRARDQAGVRVARLPHHHHDKGKTRRMGDERRGRHV